MKKFTLILILAAVGFSHSAKSQLFSNTYDLSTKFYFNEEHTAMAVYKDEVVAVATSVTGYTNFRHMSIELLDTYSGAPVSRRYEYQVNGISTLAQEIQTSVSDSRRLAALGAYPISGALPSEGLVFYDTDPNTGNVAWATTLGSSSYYLEGCSFVKDEREKTYFVLASHYENDIIITGPSNAFLCRLDHAGNPIWEMRYEDVVHESSIISKDLVYDEKHQLIIVVCRYYSDVKDQGIIITSVDASSGMVVNAVKVSNIEGIDLPDPVDIVMAHDHFYVIGSSLESTNKGFLLQFDHNLKPVAPFVTVYDLKGMNLRPTGLTANRTGNLYAGFDFESKSRPFPGVMELDKYGQLLNSIIFNVRNFNTSRGIISTINDRAVLAKGATQYDPYDKHGDLWLASLEVPIAVTNSDCARELKFESYRVEARREEFKIREKKMETTERAQMVVNEAKTRYRECGAKGHSSGLSLKSTGIFNEELESLISPTISDGLFELHVPVADGFEGYSVQVYDVKGALVHETALSGNNMSIDLSDHETGMYMLRLVDTRGELLHIEKIFIQ